MARIIDTRGTLETNPTYGLLIDASQANQLVQAVQTSTSTQTPAQQLPQQQSQQFTVGQRIYGNGAADAARAAGFALIHGQDVGSSWPSYTIGPAPQQQSQLPQSSQSLIDVIQNYLTSRPATNFRINPDLGVTEQDMTKFLTQAKQELQPYFGALFQQNVQDFQRGISQVAEDVGINERQLEAQANQQLGNLQENFARRGLTFSTARAQGEKSLLESTQQAIERGRREAVRRSLELGTSAERTLGSQNLPQIIGLEAPPQPIIKPGQLVFSRTPITSPLFTPTGGVTGSLQRQQLQDETARQRELRNISLEERGLYTK